MGTIKKAVSDLVDAFGNAVEGVSRVAVSVAKEAGASITRSAEFALALKPLVDANGGSLSGDQLRELLTRKQAAGLEQTEKRRAAFIERHGQQTWDLYLGVVQSAESTAEEIQIQGGRS